jgi:hypothetical protein
MPKFSGKKKIISRQNPSASITLLPFAARIPVPILQHAEDAGWVFSRHPRVLISKKIFSKIP